MHESQGLVPEIVSRVPARWGPSFDIVNFVWRIGIGHAGTLISAILLLLKQQWRTSLNRFAEAMTLFAVACAGLYPLLHMGRPWYAYWMLPLPNTLGIWPQFRSPLVWDLFAVSTYATVSLLFWYKLQDFVTSKHLQNMAKVMLASGLIVAYGYLMEIFENRLSGPYAPLYWALVLSDVVMPQTLWIAYIQALQLSEGASVADLIESDRQKLEAAP